MKGERIMISEIFDGIGVAKIIINLIKAHFWKNNDLIYIHSNNKFFEQDKISTAKRNTKWIVHESINKIGPRFIKIFLNRSKANLYQISRNLNFKPYITYAGYASVPYAVFDGYCIGDNHNFTFLDSTKNSSAIYKVEFSKTRGNNFNSFAIPDGVLEVDLLISCSFPIDKALAKTKHVYELSDMSGNKVTSEYLSKVFYWVSDFLDECRNKGVCEVHLLCSSRQSVSFIVGTAIQRHHPLVTAYEFERGKYTWGLQIQNGKFKKENK